MEGETERPVDPIRINIAFEQMVSAAVTAAVVSGTLSLLLALAGTLFGAASLSALAGAFVNALLAAFAAFLIGFVGSVVIGAPLFIFLEKQKRRMLWPWLAAALALALAAFLFAPSAMSGTRLAAFGRFVVVFAPAIVFALTFARGMTPFWRAAERAEAAAEQARAAQPTASQTNIIRLH